MNKKATGTLVSVAGLLHSAAESFAQKHVGTYKLRRQADRVAVNCTKAIESVSKAMIVRDKDGNRTVAEATMRQMTRISDTFVRIAAGKMERRQMYCPVFVASRVMACHYVIDDMCRRHHAPKEWRRLEKVTATMLEMLMRELGDEEELMFAVTESFEMEVAA